MREGPFYLRERMRAASENLSTLIWGALGVGFLLGLVTNISTEYVLGLPHRWLWLLASAMLTIMVVGLIIWRVYSRGYDLTSNIEVVLPFRITSNAAEILIAGPYPVTHTSHRLCERIMKNEKYKVEFLRDWNQAIGEKKRPFQGAVRRFVKDILSYNILNAIREYSDQTLTSKIIHTKYRWNPIRLSMRKLSPSEWPKRLRDSIVFQGIGKSSFQNIEFPEGMTLDVKESKDAEGIERCEVILSSRHGGLSITFSPYPLKITSGSREGAIMHKYCGVSKETELWLAKFYLQIRADFGGLRVFTKHFQKAIIPWVEGLFECISAELDWQLCLDRNLERMVVELNEQVRVLVERQASPLVT
jgi:hypothetical protein